MKDSKRPSALHSPHPRSQRCAYVPARIVAKLPFQNNLVGLSRLHQLLISFTLAYKVITYSAWHIVELPSVSARSQQVHGEIAWNLAYRPQPLISLDVSRTRPTHLVPVQYEPVNDTPPHVHPLEFLSPSFLDFLIHTYIDLLVHVIEGIISQR